MLTQTSLIKKNYKQKSTWYKYMYIQKLLPVSLGYHEFYFGSIDL